MMQVLFLYLPDNCLDMLSMRTIQPQFKRTCKVCVNTTAAQGQCISQTVATYI